MERQIARSSDGQARVEVVGRLGDRTPDATGCLVPGDREDRALAAQPGLDHRVDKQRERRQCSLRVAQHELGEPGFEPQPSPRGRPLDRETEIVLRQRADDVDAFCDQSREGRHGGTAIEEVGSHRHEQMSAVAHTSFEELTERLEFDLAEAESEKLLELVDDQQVLGRAGRWGRVRDLARTEDLDGPSSGRHRGDDAGERERGLA